MAILKEEKLAGLSGRPHYDEAGILERYGKALFLGTRTREFAPEIGRIHDLLARGERRALERSLSDLWVKAGRTRPDTQALEPVIQSLYAAKNAEPAETLRHVIERPGRRVEVIHARAGGRLQVDVTAKGPDGSAKDRTVIVGITETAPTGDGGKLERRIALEKVCTSTAETDIETKDRLIGAWIREGDENRWIVSLRGDKVVVDEIRKDRPPLRYTGTYSLGRIYAEHPIKAVTDLKEDLPMAVRRQLIGMNQTFRISLEFCQNEPTTLRGTWSSQHVTYSSMTLDVLKIHDPYDLSLILSRGKKEKSAPGAAVDEFP
ncbi:MAG: hypothetical protein AB1512_12125 [Thermodesulfobacteriota bacterium]